jgi:SAM-dependent methyltransferase
MWMTEKLIVSVSSATFTPYAALAISLGALGVTLYTFRQRRRDEAYTYLAGLWNSILDSALQYPRFLNSNVTAHFDRVMNEDERVGYDAFCYKTWGLIEDVVAKGFHRDDRFSAILHWTVAKHSRWIQLNPHFFTLEDFWQMIEAVQDDPQLVGYSPQLPTAGDDIDWDVVSRDFHRCILGPFSPEMVTRDSSGAIRNRLLVDLVDNERFGSLNAIELVDFGCGPGNLIEHLPEKIGRLVGVDKSETALKLAAATAAKRHINFDSRHEDLRTLELKERFPLAVCVNAILPATRREVVEILTGLRRQLLVDGRLLTILPSYDTTVYARKLWHDFYTKRMGRTQADRVLRAFIDFKLADDTMCSYAEDGRTPQCYHNPETIEREFRQAGLTIESKEKIYYPWQLVRRFDYGYFPDAPEEIWDWYVVARVAPQDQAAI